MEKFLIWGTTIGGLGGLIYLIILVFPVAIKLIKWWPSGWIILILIMLTVFTKKLRLIYLHKKYGPNPRRKLIQCSEKVYVISDDNTRRWIKNPRTLRELGWEPDQVERTDRNNLEGYREKGAISI